jgi:hypothetical protein
VGLLDPDFLVVTAQESWVRVGLFQFGRTDGRNERRKDTIRALSSFHQNEQGTNLPVICDLVRGQIDPKKSG